MSDTPSDLIRAGIDKARAAGKKIGRPFTVLEPKIEELLRAGWSIERVRKELHVGATAMRRVVTRLKKERL